MVKSVSSSPAQRLIEALTPAFPGEFRYIVMSSDVVWSEASGQRRPIMTHVYLRVFQALIKKGAVIKQMKAFSVGDGLEPEKQVIYTLAGVKPEPATRESDVDVAELMAYRDERGRLSSDREYLRQHINRLWLRGIYCSSMVVDAGFAVNQEGVVFDPARLPAVTLRLGEPETRIAEIAAAEDDARRDERGRKQAANVQRHIMTPAETHEFCNRLVRSSNAFGIVIDELKLQRSGLSAEGQAALAFLLKERSEIETLIASLN